MAKKGFKLSDRGRTVLKALCEATKDELDLLGYHEVGVRARPKNWATAYHFTYNRLTGKATGIEGTWISFGGQMVDLHLDPGFRTDLVIREMFEFGWDKSLGCSVAMRLAYVSCHEMAHMFVVAHEQHRKGVVHGPAFYDHMRSLVKLSADRLALRIAEYAGDASLLDDVRLKTAAERKRRECSGRINRGDWVTFTDRKGVRHKALVRRFGKRRWTVMEGNVKWHVPEHMLRKSQPSKVVVEIIPIPEKREKRVTAISLSDKQCEWVVRLMARRPLVGLEIAKNSVRFLSESLGRDLLTEIQATKAVVSCKVAAGRKPRAGEYSIGDLNALRAIERKLFKFLSQY